MLYGDYDTADLGYYAAEASEAAHTVPPMASYYSGHRLNAAYYPHLVLGNDSSLRGGAGAADLLPVCLADVSGTHGVDQFRARPVAEHRRRGRAVGGAPARGRRLLVSGGPLSAAREFQLGLRALADEFSVADDGSAAFLHLGAVAAAVLHQRCTRSCGDCRRTGGAGSSWVRSCSASCSNSSRSRSSC